jgi:hypothetical protein
MGSFRFSGFCPSCIRSLTQAQTIAAELEVGEDSELAKEITALVAVLEKEP